MTQETILTFVGANSSDVAIKNAIKMAEDAKAHLSIVVTGAAPALHSYGYGTAYGGYVNVDQWTQETKELSDALDQCSERIKELVQASDISADVQVEYHELSMMRDPITRHANVADRAVLIEGHGLAGDLEDEITSAIIFDSPIALITGHGSHMSAADPKHIFIAWDSTKHASKAVHCALPILNGADQITIAIFDPVKQEAADGEEPGADLATWLSLHGCNVTVEQHPSGGVEIATCILGRAVEIGSDLIVMGGYGHMKLKQQIFGGTTQAMLEQNQLPIMIAHK